MGSFGDSPWAKEEFSKNYLEKADIYIVERRKMFRFVTSFYNHFFKGKKGASIVELGCGDGALTEELLKIDATITGVLIDGSETMLHKARERLQAYRGLDFMKASFEELLRNEVTLSEFDFCFSSQAIHHLDMRDKASLFRYLYAHLRGHGGFVNVDVVCAASEEVQAWYYIIWREWMRRMFELFDMTDEVPEDVIIRYKSPASMNMPDTLEVQLEALKAAGFKDVDCYYKNGIFAVFGGRK